MAVDAGGSYAVTGPEPGGSRWAGRASWFAVIGAQRSRSTFVHQALCRHPEVFSPAREIAYFDDPSYAMRSRRWFLDHFADARPGQALGFKRPELLGRPESPARLAEAMPDARLVVVLREPIARTVSAYMHYVQSTYLPQRPLNDGLRLLLAGIPVPDHPQAQEVLDFSCYGECLVRYRERFDAEQILVLLDGDLDHDLPGSLERACAHIGVDPEVPFPICAHPANQGSYAEGFQMRILRTASRLVYRRDAETGLLWNHVTPARRLAYLVLHGAAQLVDRRRYRATATLAPDVRSALADRFSPDVRRMEGLIGRAVPEWPAR